MKKKKVYLDRFEISNFWDKYNEAFNIPATAKEYNLSYTGAYRLINEIKHRLAGETQKRKHRWIEMDQAIKLIKELVIERKNWEKAKKSAPVTQSTLFVPATDGTVTITTNTPTETLEEKINRLHQELMEAMADYAVKLAEEKYKPILEEAQKSNIVSLLNRKFHEQS